MSRNKTYITDTGFLSGLAEFNEDGSLFKKGLILAEGIWKDSKKRTHEFTRDRIKLIANNSNSLFSNGTEIPILADHDKTTSGYCGEVVDQFIVRPIEYKDIPNNKVDRLKHLVGKLGIFSEGVVIKTKEAIDKVSSGLKTVSPGIDVIENVIKEISLTPIPAIPGMSLFYKGAKPLNWQEAEQSNVQLDRLKEEFDSLTDTFWEIVSNIYTANEVELEERNPQQLLGENLDEYYSRLSNMLSLDEPQQMREENEEYEPDLEQYSLGYVAQEMANFSNPPVNIARKLWRSAKGNLGKLANRYAPRITDADYIDLKSNRLVQPRKINYGLLGVDAAIAGGAGLGLYGANRYLNPNSKRNQYKKTQKQLVQKQTIKNKLGLS